MEAGGILLLMRCNCALISEHDFVALGLPDLSVQQTLDCQLAEGLTDAELSLGYPDQESSYCPLTVKLQMWHHRLLLMEGLRMWDHSLAWSCLLLMLQLRIL